LIFLIETRVDKKTSSITHPSTFRCYEIEEDHIFEILINYTHKFRLLVIYRAGSYDKKTGLREGGNGGG
jgi:hypothetical protein